MVPPLRLSARSAVVALLMCLASFLGLSLRCGCLGVGLDGSFAFGRHLVLRGEGLAVDLARLE